MHRTYLIASGGSARRSSPSKTTQASSSPSAAPPPLRRIDHTSLASYLQHSPARAWHRPGALRSSRRYTAALVTFHTRAATLTQLSVRTCRWAGRAGAMPAGRCHAGGRHRPHHAGQTCTHTHTHAHTRTLSSGPRLPRSTIRPCAHALPHSRVDPCSAAPVRRPAPNSYGSAAQTEAAAPARLLVVVADAHAVRRVVDQPHRRRAWRQVAPRVAARRRHRAHPARSGGRRGRSRGGGGRRGCAGERMAEGAQLVERGPCERRRVDRREGSLQLAYGANARPLPHLGKPCKACRFDTLRPPLPLQCTHALAARGRSAQREYSERYQLSTV